MSDKFKITQGRGFTFPLPNGHTVSVQFGPMNYCSNMNSYVMSDVTAGEVGAKLVEVCAWDANEDIVEGFPVGHQTDQQVLYILNKIASLPAVEKKELA